MCQSGGVETPLQEASTNKFITVGIDVAKSVFQVHGSDASGALVFRKRLRREQVLTFRGGSVCLNRDRQRISGSSAGCFLELPI
jgi:hypothetical protein